MCKSTITESNIIRQHIGSKALYLLGAKCFCYDDNRLPNLSFRISGCKKINHIEVILDESDTYTVFFNKIRGFNFKNISKIESVFNDQLKSVIERITGLCTSL